MYTRKAELELVSRTDPVESVERIVEPTHCACATRADAALVDRAADHIRTILVKTVGRGMEEVGQYLLREFYDNNPAAYHSTSHAKHASLALLAQRCQTLELPVRQTFLANALQIAVFARQLPSNSPFLSLPPTHLSPFYLAE